VRFSKGNATILDAVLIKPPPPFTSILQRNRKHDCDCGHIESLIQAPVDGKERPTPTSHTIGDVRHRSQVGRGLAFEPEEANMKRSGCGRAIIETALIVVLLTGSANVVNSETQPQAERNKAPDHLIYSVKGADLYQAYCASCHGSGGKGDGPVALVLKTAPSDLTAISRRNHGRFPAKRLEIIIAADDLIAAHGNREMPIWGPIFHQVEWDQDLGAVRLQNLIKYLESIQAK
jgi:mono/diheme cytochrome c family protein